MKVSKNVTFAEATKSQTAVRLGIKNQPNETQLEYMTIVSNEIFEPSREIVCDNKPLGITSFFRSKDLNRAIGGSPWSQHCFGQALDMDCDVYGNGSNSNLFYFIKTQLDFDQLIWEFGDFPDISENPNSGLNPAWVHCSYVNPSENRQQVLIAFKEGGVTKYKIWE